MTSLQTFAAYTRDAASAAGYPISHRRGKRALAKAAGMSYQDLGQTLAGTHCPDPYEIERLADALGQTLIEFLRNSGMVRPRETT